MKKAPHRREGRRGIVTLLLLVLLAAIAIYATANALVLAHLQQEFRLLDARQQVKYQAPVPPAP